MTCPPGYSSDSILYVPVPFGPFNEPADQNCYRNDLGVAIGAGIMIFLLASEFVTIAIALNFIHNRTMKLTLASIGANCVVCTVFCICAIVAPQACFFLWSVASLLICVWFLNMAGVLLSDIVGTIEKVDDTAAQIMSAGFTLPTFRATCTVLTILIMIGGLGASIARVLENDKLTLAFWQMHCIGWILSVNFGILSWSFICRKAANVIEKVSENVSMNTETRKLLMVMKRFRKTSNMALALLPTGVGLWVLHLTVLPAFYYLSFVHVFHVLVTGVVSLFFFTTPNDRLAISNRLKCKATQVQVQASMMPSPTISANIDTVASTSYPPA